MKKFLLPALIFLVVVLVVWTVGSQALLSATAGTHVSVEAASLDLSLNGDTSGDLELNLGEVMPGNSGIVDITINNTGTIPGSLCIKGESFTPGFTVYADDICGVTIDPSGSLQFEINWSLPLSVHNTGLGSDFELSYSFEFANGFKVTKLVNLKGTIIDPTDTPTPTQTDTPTKTLVPTATDTLDPPSADTNTPTPTETSTDTLVPTATDTPLPTATDTLVPTPTDTPVP
jgi:hypothetical protein